MRTIKVSKKVWEEIAKRGKFGETEDDVLMRVFNIKLKSGTHTVNSKNIFSLKELLTKDLIKSKPRGLIIGHEYFKVKSWADLCLELLKWLIDKQLITKSQIPIQNYSKKGKYFINDKAEHSNPNRDGIWKNVGDFFVDVKYDSNIHVKNIIEALEQLHVCDDDIRIEVPLKNSL